MQKAMRRKQASCAHDVIKDACFPSKGEGTLSPLRGEGEGEGYESNPRDLLTNARLRCTSERVAVLTHLVDTHTSCTVEELYHSLQVSVNKVTLYRMLEQFTEAGLIERVVHPDGVRRYEYQDEHHHHITCTECGTRERVSVPEGILTRAVTKSTQGFGTITSHTLEFYGVCVGCDN